MAEIPGPIQPEIPPAVTVVTPLNGHEEPGQRSLLATELMRRLGIPGEPGPNPLGPIQQKPNGNS